MISDAIRVPAKRETVDRDLGCRAGGILEPGWDGMDEEGCLLCFGSVDLFFQCVYERSVSIF